MVFKKRDEKELEEIEEKEREPAFNDALPTLGRVGSPLVELTYLDWYYPAMSPQKQMAMINLVKRFYNLSTPLLSKTESNKYREEILNLKLKSKLQVKNGIQKRILIFDEKLDKRLNEILIELQQILARYFMPPRRGDDGL